MLAENLSDSLGGEKVSSTVHAPLPTPTELRNKARGCRAIGEATLGHAFLYYRRKCLAGARNRLWGPMEQKNGQFHLVGFSMRTFAQVNENLRTLALRG